MKSIRILVVEDHPLMQRAIQHLLRDHGTVVGVLGSAEEIAAAIASSAPDVLILDISLPGRSGLEVLPEVRSKYPALAVVIATNRQEPVYRAEAKRRGANAYVTKDRLSEDLANAVLHVHRARSSNGMPNARLE